MISALGPVVPKTATGLDDSSYMLCSQVSL